jgi:hypothetical protein
MTGPGAYRSKAPDHHKSRKPGTRRRRKQLGSRGRWTGHHGGGAEVRNLRSRRDLEGHQDIQNSYLTEQVDFDVGKLFTLVSTGDE